MPYILVVKIGYYKWTLVFDNISELAAFVDTGIKHTFKTENGDKVSYSIESSEGDTELKKEDE